MWFGSASRLRVGVGSGLLGVEGRLCGGAAGGGVSILLGPERTNGSPLPGPRRGRVCCLRVVLVGAVVCSGGSSASGRDIGSVALLVGVVGVLVSAG